LTKETVINSPTPQTAQAGPPTKTLWGLYRSGEIDPYNNDRKYILAKSLQHFPVFSRNKETAIRCLRQKNNRRTIELQQEGACGTFCCFLLLLVLFLLTSFQLV
jgi:hypothetical protein